MVYTEGSSSQSGPVAQLGARLNGIQEVTGSIPVRSTNSSSSKIGHQAHRAGFELIGELAARSPLRCVGDGSGHRIPLRGMSAKPD
jgi:hypothetical protein